ncbi:MAG TPA: protein kinase [Gemmatimonadales bacterium]|nr:protein kinase [Gemmatimonadales bacterium]
MRATPDFEPLRKALAREYTIERVIEESPDGSAAYYAVDRTLSRSVLIRAVDPAVAGESRTRSFLREAQVLASLSHVAIPAVHHAGRIDRFQHLVLEHTPGETLESRLRAGPLQRDAVIDLGDQLLDALSAMHGAGLVHHEVQPRHVVIAQERYLLDGFGSTSGAQTSDAVAGDLKAVGLLLNEAAGAQKGPLGRVLRRALNSDPSRQFRTAAEFRAALLAARRWRLPRPTALGVVSAVGSLVAAWLWLVTPPPGPSPPIPRELALLPLEVDGAQPLEPLGNSIAYLVQLELANVPGLRVTPRLQVDEWWRRVKARGAGADGVTAARALHVRWAAHGVVTRASGGMLRIRLALYDTGRRHQTLDEVLGPERDLAGLCDSLALRIVRAAAPRTDSLFEPMKGLGRVPLPALKEFLQGEVAFAQDAWTLAQHHYELAFALDSTFALAAWRIANVKRWRRLPYDDDLRTLYRDHAEQLRPTDRDLVAALLEPDLDVRFARLDSVIARVPTDGYARLLQGEELYHRGALVGRDLQQAVAVMRAAAARDPFLAMTHDHLVLSAVRAGDRKEAARALATRLRVGDSPGPNDVNMVPSLKLVYDERFVRWKAWLRWRYIGWQRDQQVLAGLEHVARIGTPWLDMPETQLRYSHLLLRVGPRVLQTHVTAHEGVGLALYALGRPGAALAEIDSAADLLDTPEARLQQAQWRVVPAALGLPPEADSRWRERVEHLADDGVVGERAAWTLALAARARGDTADARRWSARVPATSPLGILLDAQARALSGDLPGAIGRADAARVAFEAARPSDRFAGAVFHLLRGDWYAGLGDKPHADAEWLWYEATDVEGWPEGLAQAGEIDAALGVFARLKRVRLLLEAGASPSDSARGCAHLTRVLELWSRPEPAIAPLADQAGKLAEARCSR